MRVFCYDRSVLGVPCRAVPYQTVAYRTVPYTYRFGWGSFAGAAVVFMFTVADTGLH